MLLDIFAGSGTLLSSLFSRFIDFAAIHLQISRAARCQDGAEHSRTLTLEAGMFTLDVCP